MGTKKKFLLINAGHITKEYPLVSPPIGLLYLASYINQFYDFKFKLIDMKINNMSIADLIIQAKDFEPDYIGISALTTNAYLLKELINNLKKSINTSKIFLGGPYVSSFYKDIPADLKFDVAVINEGELALKDIIDYYENNSDKKLYDIPNILINEHNKIQYTSYENLYIDMEKLPYPAYELINFNDYYLKQSMTPIPPPRTYMSVMTSRGCPYQCIYCHKIFGRKFRALNHIKVADHIEYLKTNYGISEIEIIDDIFNLNSQRVINICDEIIKRKLNVKLTFPNALRADLLNENIISKLKEAGTVFISFAPETASPRLQQLIKKNVNLDQLLTAVELANKYSMFTNGFFIIGFPTETKEEIELTIKYAKSSKLHTASFFVLTPFGETPLYDMISDKTQKKPALEYAKASFALGKFNLTNIPNKKFFSYLRKANREFYLYKPLRLLRIFRDYPGKYSILRYIPNFIKRINHRPDNKKD